METDKEPSIAPIRTRTFTWVAVTQDWIDDRYVVVHQGADKQWYWTRFTERGNLPDEAVCDGSEAYTQVTDAMRAAVRENPGIRVGLEEKPERKTDGAST